MNVFDWLMMLLFIPPVVMLGFMAFVLFLRGAWVLFKEVWTNIE